MAYNWFCGINLLSNKPSRYLEEELIEGFNNIRLIIVIIVRQREGSLITKKKKKKKKDLQ